ncbi:PTS system, galactitol-specific IIC component [Caldanaerobius fijiensis DSM 17918]|uniref:PTS system, galactitol-specific IIC component n=1 Tax=Caldanaerobius fijiensis DSM 17918 TaxID=1121256 RepID=A0A1M4UW62_9THEO|nr:PTS transporter subunit IIC [Caldanaerobius fijiensis]SHE60840.1 PTS system, galactitol-specific IIC component [Caldanaerobius fijiensis DSM 17918]
MAALSYILSFKAYVMLPIVIFIIALMISIKPGQALMSSLTLGVGLAGIFIVIDFLVSNVGPAIGSLISHTGLNYPVLDVGWPSLAAMAWASDIGVVAIPMVLLINAIMISMNMTRTIDVDIWNYWHFVLLGVMVKKATGNFYMAVLATAVIAIITLKLADWTAPFIEKRFGFKGISVPTVSAITFFPIGVIGNAVIERIPYIRDLHANPDTIKKRFGVLGEPVIIGFVIGDFLGILAGYDVKGILQLGVSLAAVMVLLPAMAEILVRGLTPISEGIKRFMERRFPGRDKLYLSVDPALLLGNTSVLVTGLLLMPLSIALAFVIPGNRIIPLADLTNLMTTISMVILATNSNVIRALIIGIPIVIIDLVISSRMAAFFTSLMHLYKVAGQKGYSGLMSSFTDGGNPLRYWIFEVFKGNVLAYASLPLLALLLYASWYAYKRFKNSENKGGISDSV